MNYRETVFTPRGFLVVGGAVLLVLGIVGFLNIFTSSAFSLTAGDNFAHVVLGLVALAAVFVPGLNTALEPYYRWLVILVGAIALFFGVHGFIIPAGNPPTVLNTFGLANLEIVDNLITWLSRPGVPGRLLGAAAWHVYEVDRHFVDHEAGLSLERSPGLFFVSRSWSGDCPGLNRGSHEGQAGKQSDGDKDERGEHQRTLELHSLRRKVRPTAR